MLPKRGEGESLPVGCASPAGLCGLAAGLGVGGQGSRLLQDPAGWREGAGVLTAGHRAGVDLIKALGYLF